MDPTGLDSENPSIEDPDYSGDNPTQEGIEPAKKHYAGVDAVYSSLHPDNPEVFTENNQVNQNNFDYWYDYTSEDTKSCMTVALVNLYAVFLPNGLSKEALDLAVNASKQKDTAWLDDVGAPADFNNFSNELGKQLIPFGEIPDNKYFSYVYNNGKKVMFRPSEINSEEAKKYSYAIIQLQRVDVSNKFHYVSGMRIEEGYRIFDSLDPTRKAAKNYRARLIFPLQLLEIGERAK